MKVHLAWIGALVVTVICVAVGRRLAPRIGLMDVPDERKKHVGSIPLIGGLAIFAGVCVGFLILGQMHVHLPYFVAASLIVAIGVWDDAHRLSPYIRLAMQALSVAILAIWGGHYIADLGFISPDGDLVRLRGLAIPFTIVAGVGLINAFNMTDGLDGLCGSLSLVALVGALAMSLTLGAQNNEVRFLLILSAAVVGFLLFNFPFPWKGRASVFLGDAGSYLLGLSVLYILIRLSQGSDRVMPPVLALWFCLLPLLDMGGISIRRMIRRRSPFNADREHLHHVFTLAKFSTTETVEAMALTGLIGVLIGTTFAFAGVPENVLFYLFLGVAGFYLWRIIRAWKLLRFFSRSIDRRENDRRATNAASQAKSPDRRSEVVIESANDRLYERRSGTDRRAKKEEEVPAPVIAAGKSSDNAGVGQGG